MGKYGGCNIVELLTDDSAFDQECKYANRVETHAIYCHNTFWKYAPRKCPRVSGKGYCYDGMAYLPMRRCSGFAKNPHWWFGKLYIENIKYKCNRYSKRLLGSLHKARAFWDRTLIKHPQKTSLQAAARFAILNCPVCKQRSSEGRLCDSCILLRNELRADIRYHNRKGITIWFEEEEE